MIPNWPPTVRRLPQRRQWSGGPQEAIAAFEPEVGAPVSRRRTTGVPRLFDARFPNLTGAQIVRILLDSARKSQRGSTIQTVFRYVQKARSEPAFIPAGTGRPQGMKTISGPAEFTRPPQIVPTLRPHGMGWRSTSWPAH